MRSGAPRMITPSLVSVSTTYNGRRGIRMVETAHPESRCEDIGLRSEIYGRVRLSINISAS